MVDQKAKKKEDVSCDHEMAAGVWEVLFADTVAPMEN